MEKELPPVIRPGFVAGVKSEIAERTIKEIEVLSDSPVEITIGEEKYYVYPPSIGKMRLIGNKLVAIAGIGEVLKKAPQLSEEEIKTQLEKLVTEAFDTAVDICRILLEKNGKLITGENLSVSREIEFSLTSKDVQKIFFLAYEMLDIPGLKKTLQKALGK